MRVIFLIGREPPPALADRDRWSLTLHDFIAQCLQKASSCPPICSLCEAAAADLFSHEYCNKPVILQAFKKLIIQLFAQHFL